MNIKVSQIVDPFFSELMKYLTTGRFHKDSRFPLTSTASRTSAYGSLCRWFTTARKEDIHFDRLIPCAAISLFDDHSSEALDAFPVEKPNFYSPTRVEHHSSGSEIQADPIREYFTTEMVHSFFPT